MLSLRPEHRTTEQLYATLRQMQTAVSAFAEFPLRMQKLLVKRGWFERYENAELNHDLNENYWFGNHAILLVCNNMFLVVCNKFLLKSRIQS